MMSMQHYFALLCDLIPLDLYRWSLKLVDNYIWVQFHSKGV